MRRLFISILNWLRNAGFLQLLLTSLFLGSILGGVTFVYLINRSVNPKIVVTIPEGATVAQINQLLAGKGVLVGESLPSSLEGYLFPDTYEFFVPSSLEIVKTKFSQNFDRQIGSILPGGLSEAELEKILIGASLVEKEVPDRAERRIVAGIILKRLRNNMLLQIDASICYLKAGQSCLPITEADKEIDSPYNTYLYKGLPPGPIGNPGLDAITAVLDPVDSPYWFYLSDPISGKTLFAKNLDEHERNIVKYLNKTN